jgi:hypothetical protein
MSDFPDTDNIEVAAIAAAMQISNHKISGTDQSVRYTDKLRRFLVAHNAIWSAIRASQQGGNVDVAKVMQQVETSLKTDNS